MLAEILCRAGIPEEDALDLPTVRAYKIDVRFPLSGEEVTRGPD